MKRYIFFGFLLSFFVLLTGYETLSGAQNRIFGPHITKNGVIFRYKFPGANRVAVAGEFSDWSPALRLTKVHKQGYFEGLLPLQKKQRYRYKILVDGIWQQDPYNPHWEFNRHGEKVSILTVPRKLLTYPNNPIKIGPNRYKFWFKAPDAQRVSIAGSFNHYNPWEGIMKKDRNNIWTIEIQVFPGTHYYCFVADGVWKTDPTITTKAYNEFNRNFSKVVIKH